MKIITLSAVAVLGWAVAISPLAASPEGGNSTGTGGGTGNAGGASSGTGQAQAGTNGGKGTSGTTAAGPTTNAPSSDEYHPPTTTPGAKQN